MQTFLPYSNFKQSAEVLDKKRCWKQVVEAHQIIGVLELKANNRKSQLSTKIPWENHPAVKMWEGYIPSLMFYFDAFLDVCKEKHRINTKYQPLVTFDLFEGMNEIPAPWWLGEEKFHRAMRARLIQKDYHFYYPLFPKDIGFNGGKYFWPDMETKTFKII